MAEWYYLKNNQQCGPVAGPELKRMADTGGLAAADLVWREGMEQWTPAGRVGGLFSPSEGGSPPPPPAGGPIAVRPGAMRCHEITYEIFGDDMQVVEVELDPGETVIAEAGGMNYMEEDITFEAKMGDGSQPDAGLLGKLFQGAKRVVTGESLFMTHFTNAGGRGPRRVAFAAPYPGKIIAMNLAELGGEITCQKDAFLCAALGTEVGIAFARKLGVGLFGGEGFVLQRLRGDGMAFVHAGGTIVRKQLNGETLRVGYRLPGRVHAGHRVRHPAVRRTQVDVLRRRGAVPGDTTWTRHRLAADPAVLAAGRSHHFQLTQGRRLEQGARLGARRAGESVRRLRHSLNAEAT